MLDYCMFSSPRTSVPHTTGAALLTLVAPCGLDLAMTRKETEGLAENAWWRGLRAVRAGRVAMVDGDAMFNRPGPRLVDALEWLYAAIHDEPHACPPGFPAVWLPPLQVTSLYNGAGAVGVIAVSLVVLLFALVVVTLCAPAHVQTNAAASTTKPAGDAESQLVDIEDAHRRDGNRTEEGNTGINPTQR